MAEGCGFRDRQAEFEKLGVQVLGATFDTPENNLIFKTNEEFEFDLLTDVDRELALYYGAADNMSQFFVSRVTVVLDDKGEWVLFYPTDQMGSLYAHAQVVLDDLAILLE